jgi:hypothetical protein
MAAVDLLAAAPASASCATTPATGAGARTTAAPAASACFGDRLQREAGQNENRQRSQEQLAE